MNPAFDPKIQVEVDPNEDTEWNDILRARGIIPEKPKDPTEELEEALEEAVKKQHENRLQNKTLDELDELEDDEDEEFLEQYKQQRMAELRKQASEAKFGQVYGINKPEYKEEVTDASKKSFVVVHMSLNSNLQSRILAHILTVLAPKYPEIKFVDITANRAVENYPESHCPTLLIYKDGDVVKQYITLLQLGGNQTKTGDIEKALQDAGAIKSDDRRIATQEDEEDQETEEHGDADEDEDFFD
ncbi:DEKNAAC104174 [Brettanomyces naardenensis]|uniref:DEKNAAC104174 n=1 Tax=Brettanomyces naardenensis TaxID=13370 RepID=A0A448YQ73_BRENA|nr:DEKNAAC104174 [Brettanomyces naardenensis]